MAIEFQARVEARILEGSRLNRRRFLKYAGATAAVVGASALGLNYISQQSPSTVTPTTSTIVSSELTASSSASTQVVQLASLHGRLFFDHNGNGVQDGKEPAVAGALVQLRDYAGSVIAETLTDSSGDYKLEDVRTGTYRLHLGVDHISDKKFRYMCRSPDEVRLVNDDYQLSLLEGGIWVDIGLMEGLLTLPMDNSDYLLFSYVDLDHRIGSVRNFSGNKRLADGEHPGTEDQHQGIDYTMPCGRNLIAMAPGEVMQSEGGIEYARYVRIKHKIGDQMFITEYGHNSTNLVKIGDVVRRGQVVALSGDNNGPEKVIPHVHTSLWQIPKDHWRNPIEYIFGVLPKVQYPNGKWVPVVLDLYRDEVDSQGSPGYWTKDNDPKYATTQEVSTQPPAKPTNQSKTSRAPRA